jgi:caa(3)-type oxidase subunit IV
MATDHAHEDNHEIPESKEAAGAHGAPGHAQVHSHRGRYLKVFGALIVLTLLELGVVYAGLSRNTVIAMLILLAVTKAGAVAMYFMHLSDEKRALRLMIALPLLIPPLYAVVLIIESVARAAFVALKIG